MATKLRKWKQDGVNISCKLQELLDDDTEPLEKQIESLQRKLWYVAFRLYYPRRGFSRPFDEGFVTELVGFRYTKKATKERAIRHDWGRED